FFSPRGGEPGAERGEFGRGGGQSFADLLGLGAPALAALGQVGDAVLVGLLGGLEVLVLAPPAVAALAEEPDQGAGPALVALRGRVGDRLGGSVHASVLYRADPKSVPAALAQQTAGNPARPIPWSRPTSHRARARPLLFTQVPAGSII